MILNKEIQEMYRPLVPFMPTDPRVGYGYVPYQISPEYMDVDEAFEAGTLFPDLVTPYSEHMREERFNR